MIKQIEQPAVSAIEILSRFQSLDGSTHNSIEQASWRNAEFSLAFNVSVLFDLFRKSIDTYVTAKTLNVDDLLEVIEGEKRAKWLGHTIKRMQDALEVLKGYRPEDMPEYVFGAYAQLPSTYFSVDHAANVITPKKRGRKPKAVDPNAVVVIKEPKKRGRKPKEIDPNAPVVIKEPKKRGRKPKVVDPNAPVVIKEPKKRGRKPKVVDPNAVVVVTEPKKRGRKPKVVDPNAVVVVTEPKKRGRKPKVIDPNSVDAVTKRGFMVPVIAEAPTAPVIAQPAKPAMVPPPLPRPVVPVVKVESVAPSPHASIPPPPPRPPLPVKVVTAPTPPQRVA